MKENNPYNETDVLVDYVIDHYHELMTDDESGAMGVLLLQAKGARSRRNGKTRQYYEDNIEGLRSPTVDLLLKDGRQACRKAVADRIPRDHRAQLSINRCPKCDCIVRTPKARQCLWCSHDWHGSQD